jgi:4a-hydroxytetrahydrobiopterin dehydratase
MNRNRLETQAVEAALAALNDVAETPWAAIDGKLHKEFQFADFVEAFGFMTKAALAAESMDHHPEWFNVYKKVRVDLSTHDVGGITELDFALAERMEALSR